MFGVGLGVVATCVAAYYGVPCVYTLMVRRRLRRRTRLKNAVVLTFDDGPGEGLTPAILSVLREHGCTASFFVPGRNVWGREQIVRRIVEEGHDICSHGYDHLDHWRTSPLRSIADIKAGWRALDAVLGVARGTYPFRPPYGRLNLASLLFLWWRRVPICLWTIDSGDTPARSKLPGAGWCAGEVAARGGGVLLYHDFERRRSHTQEYVLGSLVAVLRGTSRNMLTCRPMSDLWDK